MLSGVCNRMSLVVTLIAGLVGSASHAQSAAPARCERACLIGFVDQYLARMIAHDPSRLPLDTNIFTVHGEYSATPAWLRAMARASSLGNYKAYFADPEFGQVAYIGTVVERGNLREMGVRLLVSNGKIL